jgi:hypothetical protein
VIRLVRSLASDDSGASLTQFALILPAFLILIFGAIEGGFLMWQFQQGEIASTRAVRLAATRTLLTPGSIPDCGPSTPSTTPAGTLCINIPDTSIWATCRGNGTGGGACGPDVARVAVEISRFYPAVKPEDIIIELSGGGMGFVGLGHPVPVVTVRFDKVDYEFIVLSALGGLAALAMPTMSASAPAEDMLNGPGA